MSREQGGDLSFTDPAALAGDRFDAVLLKTGEGAWRDGKLWVRGALSGLLAMTSIACGPGPVAVELSSVMKVEVFSASAPLSGLSIQVADPDGVRSFTLDGFRENQFGRLEIPAFGVANQGQLTFRARILQDDQVVSEGEIALALEPDFVWEVGLARSEADPCGPTPCGSRNTFPIDPEARNSADEKLWIVWAGAERGTIN